MPMDQGLKNLLVKIWRENSRIPQDPEKYIYDKYYALTAAPKQGNQKEVEEQQLQEILDKCEGKVEIHHQRSEKIPGVVHFYHLEPSDWKHKSSIGLVRWRVYLNPKEHCVLPVLKYIVVRFVHPDNARQLARPIKAKVARILDQRPDPVVVYAVDDRTAGYIAEATNKMRTFEFNDSIPAMTRKMATGISIGAEPVGNDHSKSFGQVRCNIIAKALCEALKTSEWDPQNPATFVNLTARYLKEKGIDPEHPELQKLEGVHHSQSSSASGS